MTNFTMSVKSCMITQLLGWFVVQIKLSIKMVIILILLRIILWTSNSTTEDFQ